MKERQLNVVAIDGPAGAGKSTIAREVARALNLPYLDTGAMYRGITCAAVRRGVDVGNEDAVAELARNTHLEITEDSISVDGVDATAEIRGERVTSLVSAVAANSAARKILRQAQREWAVNRGGGVVEGRDIATVVFPDARLKVYLTASPHVRAQRRVAQIGGDVDQISAAIAERDYKDSNRDDSPLRESVGALVIDTSDRSIGSVVDEITEAFNG